MFAVWFAHKGFGQIRGEGGLDGGGGWAGFSLKGGRGVSGAVPPPSGDPELLEAPKAPEIDWPKTWIKIGPIT